MKAAMPSVLVVDDNPKHVDLLVNTLKDDCLLGIAPSGRRALEYVAKYHPDLILLDIMMPEMDGIEVCSRLKTDPETKDIPIVFLSAMSETDTKTRGFEMGAVDYITKPFRPSDVKARVRAHLKLKETWEKLQTQNIDLKQKIEAMGTLVYGIAHHFNNLLIGIQGRTSLMLMEIDPSHLFYEHLKGIEGQVLSAGDLTKQILGFARKGNYEVRALDFNELIKKTSRVFGHTKKSSGKN
jgi:DNA-binding response OmpR family regulator